MDEKEFLNISTEERTLLITKMIMIRLIENFSFDNVIDTIYNTNKDEKNELDQTINILIEKTNFFDLTNIIFDLKDLYKESINRKKA